MPSRSHSVPTAYQNVFIEPYFFVINPVRLRPVMLRNHQPHVTLNTLKSAVEVFEQGWYVVRKPQLDESAVLSLNDVHSIAHLHPTVEGFRSQEGFIVVSRLSSSLQSTNAAPALLLQDHRGFGGEKAVDLFDVALDGLDVLLALQHHQVVGIIGVVANRAQI